jgi:tRNA/tmRNA/rRNA uracil-C5-methylase (TrmA/RlmC/RlmD family)
VEALTAEAPSEAQLRAMLGEAAEEPDLSIVCRVGEYESLLATKVERVRQLFGAEPDASTLGPLPEISVNTSPPCFFRQRAEFRMWHAGHFVSAKRFAAHGTVGGGGATDHRGGCLGTQGTDGFRMFYAMFPPSDRRRPVEVPAFPMGSRRVNELMQQLRELVLRSDMLRVKLYEVRFLTTLRGARRAEGGAAAAAAAGDGHDEEALITMIYHKPIDERWVEAAKPLAAELGVSLVGRSRKRKLVVGKDWVVEQLSVAGEKFQCRLQRSGTPADMLM